MSEESNNMELLKKLSDQIWFDYLDSRICQGGTHGGNQRGLSG